MKRFFWIPFCLLLALFGATLLNAAVADGLVTDWCAELDKLQDTAQAENWDSVRDDLSALHEIAAFGAVGNAGNFDSEHFIAHLPSSSLLSSFINVSMSLNWR